MTGEDWVWPRLPRTAGIVCRQAPGDTSLYGGRQGGAQAEISRGWSNNPASGQEGGLQGRKVSVTPIPPPMWPFSAQLLLQIFVNNHHVFITYFLSFSAFMASNLASMQLFNFLANSPLSNVHLSSLSPSTPMCLSRTPQADLPTCVCTAAQRARHVQASHLVPQSPPSVHTCL